MFEHVQTFGDFVFKQRSRLEKNKKKRLDLKKNV